MNFGGTVEDVVTREEFPLSKALETLKDETIAVIGYGVQGPGQSLNLKDNGFNVIVGQRKGSKSWDKAIADGWVEGKDLFEIEEAASRGTIIQYLLSDAGQISMWPTIKKHLTPGKALYFSHGFGITYKERTGIIPPEDVDVILVAPKGSGTSLRRMFLQGRGLNSSYAIFQDATGRAMGVTEPFCWKMDCVKILITGVIWNIPDIVNNIPGHSGERFPFLKNGNHNDKVRKNEMAEKYVPDEGTK